METKSMYKKRTLFETDAQNASTGKAKLIPTTFVANNEEFIFDKNDEIFGLSGPTRKPKIPSDNCSYCNKAIGRRAERHFCEFCSL